MSWGAVSIQTMDLQESQAPGLGGCGPSWDRCGSDPGTHLIASSTFCGSTGTRLNCTWIWGFRGVKQSFQCRNIAGTSLLHIEFAVPVPPFSFLQNTLFLSQPVCLAGGE